MRSIICTKAYHWFISRGWENSHIKEAKRNRCCWSEIWKEPLRGTEILFCWSGMKLFFYSKKNQFWHNTFYFFLEGTVTNPAIWLVLSTVRIFLSLTIVTVTAGNSGDKIVVLVNFPEWVGGHSSIFRPFYTSIDDLSTHDYRLSLLNGKESHCKFNWVFWSCESGLFGCLQLGAVTARNLVLLSAH